MEKVSVIVPAYNCEKTIEKCITSLLDQSYRNVEIIVVDDGSIDNTYSVLQKYSSVKVFRQKNCGVSCARNKGIKEASGKYIVFCDADDYVSKEYIQVLMENRIDNESLVIGKYSYIGGGGVINKTNQLGEDCVFDLEDFNDDKFLKLLKENCIQGPVCKLFNLDIIRKNKIKFRPKMNWGEDFCFVLDYLNIVKKGKSVENVIYYYVMNCESATIKIQTLHMKSFEYMFSHFKSVLESNKIFWGEMERYYYLNVLNNYFDFNLLGFSDKNYRKKYKKFKTNKIILEAKKKSDKLIISKQMILRIDNYTIWRTLNFFKRIKEYIKKI